ncbi:MAG: CheY-like chemotaxis protein [Planctomycetota bacterium]|jgi:CheY-like chemotaxis protein
MTTATPTSKKSTRRPGTILLIDDDPGDCELTRRALKAAGSEAKMFTVGNGEEALDYLNQRGRFSSLDDAPTPDLILLDINMPRLDGRGFLKKLREETNLRSMPVVTLTTSMDSRDVDEMYQLGTNSFVTKPNNIGEFVKVIESINQYWFGVVSLPSAS